MTVAEATEVTPVEEEEVLMVKLPKPLKRRLRLAAAVHGTNMSRIVRDALDEKLNALDRRRQRSEAA